jgi:putative oxidoreductase
MKFFSPAPIWQDKGIGLLRILVGIFMIYHGIEIFDAAKIKEYASWEPTKSLPAPLFLSYLGKFCEFLGGILLLLGLFTRVGTLFIILPMIFVAFFIGHAKIWYEDQYPFLFILLGLVFFFTGPGAWSIDKLRYNKTV